MSIIFRSELAWLQLKHHREQNSKIYKIRPSISNHNLPILTEACLYDKIAPQEQQDSSSPRCNS